MMSQLILWFIDLHFVHFATWGSSFFCQAHSGVTLANRHDYHPETVFVKIRVALSAAELSSFLLLCPRPARNQNWCSYPGLCWTDTSIFLIFLPNKFIFKQVQIHGLNYWVDTSSVFSVDIFTAKTFCRIWQSRKGDTVSFLTTWALWQQCFIDILVRTQ